MVLEIDVVEVRGKCPVHKVGDRIVSWSVILA
jgi:hypothetical protein